MCNILQIVIGTGDGWSTVIVRGGEKSSLVVFVEPCGLQGTSVCDIIQLLMT